MLRAPLLLAAALAARPERPNVLVILADDLGWGDVHALAPEGALATPHLDRLAAEGMAFTDAHSPSAVCTPTRYGVLTGRYCWRTALQSGVLGGYSPPLLEQDRATLGTLLRAAGYRTAAIGKWHLGLTLPLAAEGADTSTWSGDPGIDWEGTIPDGPLQHGFDSFFGICASLDMAPYVWVRDDRFQSPPVDEQPATPFPHFVRVGPRAADFHLDRVLFDLTDEATRFVAEAAREPRPFFLYLPLTAPHKPTLPHERFRGTTGLGEYGDFVAQVDWCVGQVLASLDEAGVADRTLVVCTSDNGSYMRRLAEGARDHVDDPAVQGFRGDRYRPNGPWRGTKADVYEAGHRVPLLVRWPGAVRPGSRCAEPVCLVDLFATLAAAAGVDVPAGAAEDSVSLAPLLAGRPEATRGAPVVHHSVNGTFALREGRWKAVFSTGSGGREAPVGRPFDGVRLFDLGADPGERTDVAADHPDVVRRLEAALRDLRGA